MNKRFDSIVTDGRALLAINIYVGNLYNLTLVAAVVKGTQPCQRLIVSGEATAPARFLLNYSEFVAERRLFAMMAASALSVLRNILLFFFIFVISFVSGFDKGMCCRLKIILSTGMVQ